MATATFAVVFVFVYCVSSLEVGQSREGVIEHQETSLVSDLDLASNNINDRRARSFSALGKSVNFVMSRIVPWQKRIPILTGARFVGKRENIKYWEKPGGKSEYEKDLALILRKRSEDRPNVEERISAGTTHKVYRLRIENFDIKGEWSTHIITYF